MDTQNLGQVDLIMFTWPEIEDNMAAFLPNLASNIKFNMAELLSFYIGKYEFLKKTIFQAIF